MANKIRLRDDTEYSAVWCGASDGVLNIELSENMTLAAAVDTFSDKARTAEIAYLVNGATAAAFADYTTLLGVHRDRWNGRVMIQLEKAAVTGMLEVIELEVLDMEEE